MMAYVFLPMSQKTVPNTKAMINVKKNLTAVYAGFLQYDKRCFHRHARHCIMKGCEYLVGKCRSLEPGGGMLSSLIKALFLLQLKNIYGLIIYIHIVWNVKHLEELKLVGYSLK